MDKNLNPKIFDKDVEQVPIRQGFGEGLLIAGTENENVVALCADLVESTKMEAFVKKFPERFVEIGVAEQNLASVASGMSAMGKIPVISSYAMFSPGRNWEQIRTTICYNDRAVIIAGSHAGISVGPDGGTHQALEDVAITRVIPNMRVLTPCDSIQAKKATIEALKDPKPTYIRLAREKTPIITTEDFPYEIGKSYILHESENPKVTLIACGALVYQTLISAKELESDGVGTNVVYVGSVKPLDKDTILEAVKKTGKVVTIEEHQIAGGMGSAVAEMLSQNYPVPIRFVGVEDKFGQSGKPEELLKHYGLSVENIKDNVKKLLQ